jgi:hypothetical protein
MINNKIILLLVLATALFQVPVMAYSEAKKDCNDSNIIKQISDKSDKTYKVVETIEPMSLVARLENNDKKYIVHVIDVIDPVKLCKSIDCIKLFVSRREKKLREGMRAVLISEFDKSCHISNTKLIWGSASVLVLQPDRNGSGLWEVVNMDNHQAFQLMTESNHGTITRNKKKFSWKEEPDL